MYSFPLLVFCSCFQISRLFMQWFHDLTIFCLNISNFAIITVAMLIIVEFFMTLRNLKQLSL